MHAFRAIHFIAEPSAWALYSLLNSDTKALPSFPSETLKGFLLQWITSEYASVKILIIVSESYSPQTKDGLASGVGDGSGRAEYDELCGGVSHGEKDVKCCNGEDSAVSALLTGVTETLAVADMTANSGRDGQGERDFVSTMETVEAFCLA